MRRIEWDTMVRAKRCESGETLTGKPWAAPWPATAAAVDTAGRDSATVARAPKARVRSFRARGVGSGLVVSIGSIHSSTRGQLMINAR